MATNIVPREARRQLAALREAGTSGKVTFMGHEKYAWNGSLVTRETYKALKKAGARQ